jgi:hypothetical protein
MEPECSLPRSQEPYLSQIDPIHTIQSYLSKIHFNIIQPPTPFSHLKLTSSPKPFRL